MTEKIVLRKKAVQMIKDFSLTSGYAVQSAYVCGKILESDFYKNAGTVFAYLHLPGELDTDSFIKTALSDGKQVCVPKIIPSTNVMEFYYLDGKKSIDSQTSEGYYGIREPLENLRLFVPHGCTPGNILMLVPGLFFSPDGKRLGRGKGFYDAYISRLKSSVQSERLFLCGICFGFQVLPDIPVEKHDIVLDKVVRS